MNQTQESILPANIKVLRTEPIAVEGVNESASNPRTVFADLDELAASIKRQGVLQPILVRDPGDDMPWELIAGARRLRASKLAGLKEIPAVVLDCTSEEADEIRLVENSQRADVHPMEEAEAIEKLVAAEGKRGSADPIDAVGRRLGKPRGHIHRRIRLLKLPDKARAALKAGDISLEHASIIVRLATKEMREKAWKTLEEFSDDGTITVKRFAELVEDMVMRDLSKAQFDTADSKLVPDVGACGPCPKRTGNATDLFGKVDGPDLCTDGACFQRKLDAAWKKRVAAAETTGESVMSQTQQKQVFRYGNDSPEYGSGYKKVDERYDKETLRGLKKAGIKPTIARGREGQIIEVYRTKDIEALSPASTRRTISKEEKERNRKDKEKKADRRLLLAGVIREVEEEGIEEMAFLKLLAQLIYDSDYGQDLQRVLKRRGVKTRRMLLETNDRHVLRGIILEDAIGDPAFTYGSNPKVVRAAKALRVDLKKLKIEQAKAAAVDAKKVGKK